MAKRGLATGNRPAARWAAKACVAAVCGWMSACAGSGDAKSRMAAGHADSPDVAAPRSLGSGSVETSYRDDPWVYDGRTGRVITTPHYRVYMTQTDPAFLGRVPVFLEASLAHYRVVATGESHPLPDAPIASSSSNDAAEPLSTFVFRTRAEWERLTRQMLGSGAGPFLKIQRGGYAWGGVAVLFDLDVDAPGERPRSTRDTMSIAAHEGWHQYTQRTFKQPLPTWLEEGIATLCEGHRWVGGPSVVEFRERDNPERREQLARAMAAGRLKSIERLVLETPADLAAEESEQAVDYYSQVWAVGLFLKEGAAGRYSGGLRTCIEDAAAGRMGQRIVEVLGPERAAALAGDGAKAGQLRGLAVLEAYFGREPGGLAELDRGYRRFAAELAGPIADPQRAPG